MKVLHIDINHPLIIEQFAELGFTNDEDYTSSKEQIEKMTKDADLYSAEDKEFKERIEARNNLEGYCFSIKNFALEM